MLYSSKDISLVSKATPDEVTTEEMSNQFSRTWPQIKYADKARLWSE